MIREVTGVDAADLVSVRELMRQYAASFAGTLCFQALEQELAGLPGRYAPPSGRLLLAEVDGAPAGCVALHRLSDGLCEMKRLYVRPECRGTGIGVQLVTRIIGEGRSIGYSAMRLDTIPSLMPEATALYRSIGFREIERYNDNTMPGALFLELKL